MLCLKSQKRPKKQMTLSQTKTFSHLRKDLANAVDITPLVEPPLGHQIRPVAQSFNSVTESNAPSEVFTPAATGFTAPSASAATSFQEETKRSSPDLFPTQDMMVLDADEGFTTSFKMLCEPTKADKIFHELCEKTPFKKADLALSHQLSFRHRYELERVADALRTTPKELLKDIGRRGISSTNDYDAFWGAVRKVAKERDHHSPDKSSSSAWNSASDSFFESETRQKSVYLSGALSYASKADDGLYELKLKPLQLDTSCRFHRKYGPSRFMVLSLPSLTANIPSKYKEDARSGVLTQGVASWLATVHEFLGRKWRAFFLEADKKKTKVIGQVPGFKVHLFAVSGEDLSTETAIGVEQFLDWHISIEHNLQSTNLKLFQRFSLGLSKTIPTVVLHPSEFVGLPDPDNHAVMNDGCARMSMSLAKEVARHIGLSEVPSVFQARIAGAKGLWMVVPDDEFGEIGSRNYCVEIADSQLKIKPLPEHDSVADEARHTFEVLKFSVPGKAAALNTQLLTILYDRGVDRKTLANLLVQDIGTFHNGLELSMRSPLQLRSWVQSSGMSRGEGEVKMIGSWPDESEEQAIMLIENGFTPETCPTLRECLRSILVKYLNGYVERLQIRLPCSTFLFCIADPYGILEPNEVHLSFSEVWKDPVSGFKESFVDGRDILVARLPALLPSDIQRRQAVWKRQLHHFKDVVVFSTKGEIPLAHMLSGGDYDGDTPWICWDPDVVKCFENADLPEMPSKKDCGLVQQNRQVKDIFVEGTSPEQLASKAERFFAGCFAFNLNPSYLGQCTHEHEKMVYYDGSLAAPNAIMLATLSGYLVDSAKQGDMLSKGAWQKIRKRVSPLSREAPAYKNDNREVHKRESNIIDYLKFWQAIPAKERILTQYNKHWPQEHAKDSTLCQPWSSMRTFGNNKHLSAELAVTLEHLKNDIQRVVEDYLRQQPKEGEWATGQFRRLVESFHHRFRSIEPSKAQHEYSHLWTSEGNRKFGHWALLRSSCLYSEHARKKCVWYLAGEELCFIKAQSSPEGSRNVLKSVYAVLKCDPKIAKRAQRRLEEVELEEEEAE